MGLALLVGILLLSALGVRLYWQHRAQAGQPVSSPPLSMDDSSAFLPVTPPPVPADNAGSLRAALAGLRSLATDPKSANSDQLAASALDIGDLWRAENVARSVLQLDPKDRSARLTLAASLRRQSRFEPAERIYRQLLQEDRRDSDAYLGMADTMFAANERPGAFDWLARAAAEGAQTPLSLSTIAHRYQDWKDYPKAEETAARALQIAPDNVDALLQKASIQVESGKLDAGYQTLDTLLKKDPDNGLAYRLMGVVLMNATFSHQDMNRARGLLERAVELVPRDLELYRSVAVLYRQQRLYRLAAQAYDALLHLDPTSLDGRYGLGQVYALLGRSDLSKQQLALYKRLDERQRRVTRLSEEAAHHPTQADGHASLARYLESSGDYARALPEYQAAAGLDPHNAALQTDVTRFYAHLGSTPPEHKAQ